MMSRQRGYSLIELINVVAIILVIAAIAIPNMLRSRMAANEASAASSLRTIGTANVAYSSLFGVGYAGELAHLGPLQQGRGRGQGRGQGRGRGRGRSGCTAVSSRCADMLDAVLSGVDPATANPEKSGYRFTYYVASDDATPASPNTTYAVVATPVAPGNSGVSTYCFDHTNLIWKDASGTQTTADATGCANSWPVGGNIGPI